MTKAQAHLKMFRGTDEELSALFANIQHWLNTTGAIPVQYIPSVHFHPEDRKWYILIMVIYQTDPKIARPDFQGVLSRN